MELVTKISQSLGNAFRRKICKRLELCRAWQRQTNSITQRYERNIFIFLHLTINRERQQHKLVSTKNSNEKNGQKKAPKAVNSRTNLPEVKISTSVESSTTLNFFVVPSQSRLVAAILKRAQKNKRTSKSKSKYGFVGNIHKEHHANSEITKII